MADQEDELKCLKEKNNELVQKVQYWKMTAAQRENEKLELMKENNELRLKVIRLKTGGAAEARKLDAALQSASEQALSHLVQASSAVARTIELAKTYMRDREGVDTVSPRWSNITNSSDKVHRVPPMMGGQSIQPVVSLSRAALNISGSRLTSRSPNSSRNVTVRALPMHMLQDVYIPLTRIDLREIPHNNDTESEAAADDSGNIPFDASMEEAVDESQNMTDDENYDSSRQLEIVTEDVELETEELTPPRPRVDNPLEGPSWLLDVPSSSRRSAGRANFEPDSTTEEANTPPLVRPVDSPSPEGLSTPEPARVFTPTVRRRKRAATPPPGTSPTHTLNGSRVLQVLVPKMRLSACASPPKRRAEPRFDAPSPNGATDSRVIVSEELENQATENHEVEMTEPEPSNSVDNRDNRNGCSRRDSGDSDSGSGTERVSEGRTRRNRKPVTYKEKPLNSYSRRDSGDSDSGSGTERISEGRTRRNRKPVTYKEKPLNRKLRR